jgi:hypothetical protein
MPSHLLIMIRIQMKMTMMKYQEERIEREDHTEDIMTIEEEITTILTTELEIMSIQELMKKTRPIDTMILEFLMILRGRFIEALMVWKEITSIESIGLAQANQKDTMTLCQNTLREKFMMKHTILEVATTLTNLKEDQITEITMIMVDNIIQEITKETTTQVNTTTIMILTIMF